MPCWTVQQSEVKLSGLNPEYLKTALVALGFRVNRAEYTAGLVSRGSIDRDAVLTFDRFTDKSSVIIRSDGTVTVNLAGSSSATLADLQNEVKRAYAVQVVHAAAKKFGWNMKQTAENKFAVTRRF